MQWVVLAEGATVHSVVTAVKRSGLTGLDGANRLRS
jgi:hypothetical protein